MWLVARAQRGVPPPAALAADMRPPLPPPGVPAPSIVPEVPQQPEAVSLGPQPTPELEAIAREIDALVKERLTLETEVNARQRELTMQSSEADSLQSELDTLSATQKQLENQKGEAQKRLNDLKTQVEKLRSQVSAQEAAASETEAEVLARRAAAQTLKERERGLHEDVARAESEAERLTAQLSRTVLANSQAKIKMAHLEQQLAAMTEAAEALAAGAPTAAQLALQPEHGAATLARLLRGTTPHDELEDDSFNDKSNGFAVNGSGFESDPFKDNAFSAAPAHDPFAPASGSTQDGFGASAFASGADPFAGDAFASTDNNTASNNDSSGWAEDPFAVLHAPTRASTAAAAPSLPPKKHKTPPPRPAPPRPGPPNKTDRAMEFTEDPFKDYRYEDPFNIQDPFADVTDSKKFDPFNRPTSVAGFETDDFFGGNLNGFPKQEKVSGRVSAPPVAYDPFNNKSEFKPASTNNNDSWAAFPTVSWSAEDAWGDTPKNENHWGKADNWANKTDDWASKNDDWATEWGNNTDQNKNLNETWPSNTMPSKKEKSPRPVKLAKSLVHTIGGIGRTKHAKEKKEKLKAKNSLQAGSSEFLPSEEQQWAWAASESKRVQAESEARRQQEDAELQLALAISRQEK